MAVVGKKLVTEAISPAEYKKALNDVCGIFPENVHDYYGMVEQTGTIYMECKCGHLHASCFSDVLIRRPEDFSLADRGEKGLIEVVSILPPKLSWTYTSYRRRRYDIG